MIKERRDNKGRLLHTGEAQIKNGSYIYRYVDTDGKRKSVSSWRLLPWDIGREGNAKQECLRDMEERVKKSRIKDEGKKIPKENATINDFWEMYLSMKCSISENTLVSYIYLYNKRVRKSIGRRQIREVKYSDIKKYYIEMAKEGLGISSLNNLQNILGPVFQLAVREGYISQNPTDGLIREMTRRKDWQVKTRKALTEAQQEAFVNFVANSYEFRGFLPLITLFLGCGLRVGELTGLRWEDVYFDQNIISVNHTLNYNTALDGRCQFFITFPKSKSGVREIPMLEDVRKTLKELYARRDDFNSEHQVMVDGYTNFIFRDLNGNLYSSQRINANLRRMQKQYNEQETARAKKERRDPLLLPDFTCHHLRHTFITRLCEKKMSLKAIQVIAGHAHAETTIRVYAAINDTRNQDEMALLNGKMKIK